MANDPRDTPNPFDIYGTNTGTLANPFEIYDTYNLPDPENTENAEKLFGTDDIPELPIFGLGKTDFTPEENDWVDSVIAAPRGLLRGVARTIPMMGEGVWALLDLATNLTGQEDWLNPKESAFINRMDELRDAIGYEDSVAGRTGEALGSVLGFVGTSIATGGAGAAARLGSGYRALKAGETALGGAKTLGAATQIAAPGMAAGVSEASSRMREYEERTGEEISIADRNLVYALGIPLGATEAMPIVRPLSMLFSKINKTGLPKRTLDTYMDYAKSAAITGTAEGVQEALAGIGQDAISKGIYDEDTVIGESIASEFGYGGSAGAIFDIGVNLLTKGRPRGRPPAGTPEEGAPIPEEPVIPSRYKLSSDNPEVNKVIGDNIYVDELSRNKLTEAISILQKTIETEIDPIKLESAKQDLDALILERNNIDSSDDDDLTAEEEQEIIDQSIPRDVVEQVFGEEKIVLPENNLTAPVVVEPEGKLVIPPNVKTGDIIDMFDALGNPYKATITAISEKGSVKVLNQQGQEVVVNQSPTAITNNVNSLNHVIIIGPHRGKKLKDLTEEEISETKVILENSLKDTYNLMNVKGGLNPALLDLNAIKLKEKRKVQPTEEIINATIDTPQAEIEATAKILKDETPPVVLQEDIETEAFKQQRTKLNPKLESAIDREIELENEIEQAEQQDELNKADTLKNELVSIQQQQEELIKEEKVPVKRGRLIESFTRPDDNEIFTGRFPDKQSIDTYNNKNSKKIKTDLGLTTPAHKQFKKKYDKYITDTVKDAYKNDNKNFKLKSYYDLVSEEQGSIQPEQIIQALDSKNINTTDNTFKRYLFENTNKKSNLKDTTGLERKEIFRQISLLPTMKQRNSGIDQAFNESRENTKAFSKQEAIKQRTQELIKDNTKPELYNLAIANGISEDFISPNTKDSLARGIARQEINNQTSAEENYEQLANKVIPNVLVRKGKTSKKDQANNLQKYVATYPDGKRYTTKLPVDIGLDSAKDQTARNTFGQRIEALEEENKRTKTAPQASPRDYELAVTRSLYSRQNPLGELRNIAGPQVKQSQTPALETNQVEEVQQDAPNLDLPNIEGLNYQGNLYRFKDNINGSDIVMNLKRRVKRTMPNANVVAVDNLFSLEGNAVAGVTIGDMIAINLETNPESGKPRFASPTDTIYHEAVHYFKNNEYFPIEVIELLEKNKQKIINIAEGRLNAKVDTFEEAIAIASGYYNEQKLQGRIPFEFSPPIRRFFEPIFKYFNQVAKYFSGKKYRKLEDVFDAIRTGDLYQDAVDNPRILSPPQQKYSDEVFRNTGYIGPYKGAPLANGMNAQYDNQRNIQPFYSDTPSYGGLELKVNDNSFNISLLKEAIKETKTKSTKSNNWLIKDKQGRYKLAGSSINFSPRYIEETNLEEWLAEQVETNTNGKSIPKEISIKELKEYVEANEGVFSIQLLGNEQPLRIIPYSQNEKQAIKFFKNQAENSARLLDDTNKAIQSFFINKPEEYKTLKDYYYDGPDSVAQAAFYDLTRNLDEIQKAYTKLNLPDAKESINKNFDLLRVALNIDVKSPDYIFSTIKGNQIEQVISELTLDGNIFNDLNALIEADPDGQLRKFLVGLSNRNIDTDPLLEMVDKIGTDAYTEMSDISPSINAQLDEAILQEIRGFDFAFNFAEDFANLIKAKFIYKKQHAYNMQILYAEPYNPSVFGLPPTGRNRYGDYANFNIDTISGEFNRADRLILEAKERANPNTQLWQLEKDEGQPIQKISETDQTQILTEGFINQAGERAVNLYDTKKVYTENKQTIAFIYNPAQPNKEFYTSGHFQDIKNMFAHIRTSDVYTVDENGELIKVLLIEEIQSDMFNDIKKAKEKFIRDLNEGDPRKIQGINELSEEDTYAALKQYPTTRNMGKIPLIGFPKPNNNRWQDYVMEQIAQIANNNAYDAVALTTTAIQAERNQASLQDNFDFLSFYASVNPKDVGVVGLSTEFMHRPTSTKVDESTLIELGYLNDTDLVQNFADAVPMNSPSMLMGASQYFADLFSNDPNSYEFQEYVTHTRLLGMLGGFISRDITVPLSGSDKIFEHRGTQASNHMSSGSQNVEENGDLNTVLPKDMADLIGDQILRGVQPQYKKADINNITASERDLDNNTINTSRLYVAKDMSDAVGAGYINLNKISANQIQSFFAKSGWEIYDTTYPQKLQKAIKKLYGTEPTVLGKGAVEIAKELFPKADIKDIQNLDYWANQTYKVPFDELTEQEQYQINEELFTVQSNIQERKGVPLLLESAFKSGARLQTKGQPTKKHLSRFNLPVYKFETNNQVQVTPRQKYSSTPADAQRANIWKRTIDYLGNIGSSRFFSGLGAIPQLKKFMELRYKALGKIEAAEQTALDLYNETGPYLNPLKTDKPEGEFKRNREQFTAYMTGGINIDAAIIQDEGLRKVAIKSKKAIDNVGRLLVKKGLLPQAKYEENEGAYLPTLYLKHLLKYPNRQPLSFLKKKKEVDDETKLILGDVTELSPEYRVLNGLTRPLRDMIILDFFNEVSQNQNWALRDGDMLIDLKMEDGSSKKVSALWVIDEATRLEEQADYFENAEPQQAQAMRNKAKEYRTLATPVLESIGYGEDNPTEGNFIRMPKTKKYGMLKGVAVRKEIYDDIIGTFTMGNTDNAYNKFIATMAKGTSIWKLLKVPLNPPSVVRNVGSNMILMNLVGGIPIHKVMPRMYQAIKEIQNNGKHWKIAQEFGIKNTGFSVQEMYRIGEQYLDLLQEEHPLGDVTRFFSPKIIMNKIFKKAGDIYQFTESVGKTAVIIDAMERQGMSDIDAFMLAQKSLFDYSDVPEAGKQFRKAPIGMPFFTFYYKALPALIETAVKHPMRFAPYVALSAGLTQLVSYAFGFEDDEEEKLQKSLQPWLERRTGVYVLPYKDSDGRFQFLDVGYFFPWSMYTDSFKAVSNGEFMELQRTTGLFSGPFVDILLAMKTNKDPFTQRTIWDKRDPVEDRIQNIFWYMYSLGMPSWLTPTGAISKTTKAISGKPRPTGEPADTIPQALLRFVGVNVYGIDTEDSRTRNIKRMRQEIQNIKQRLSYSQADKNLTEEEKERQRVRYMQLLIEKKNLLQQYKIDTAIPRSVLERESKLQ